MKAARTIPILLLLAFLLPFGVRYLVYYRGAYRAPEIAAVNPKTIVLPAVEHTVFEDHPMVGEGRVILDLSKQNNLETDDLTPLRNRLGARGLQVTGFDGQDTPLAEALRGATALVVAGPTLAYTADEVAAVKAFVEDGGRLLIAADPTRPIPAFDEYDPYAMFFSISAAPEANSIANPFGIVFFADYLYNITENAGNFRNVRFAPGESAGALGEGVQNVIFFAAHSLRSGGPALLVGDKDTQSNVRRGESPLTPAALSADGQVLALGDITFLTPPYNTQGDNDRFLSNLADWLAQGRRDWSLEEFPYLFQRPVDIVQTFAEALEPGLIAATSPLQETLSRAGLQAGLSQEASDTHDAIYLATFNELEAVKDYLKAAQVEITYPEEAATPTEEPASTEIDQGKIQVEGLGAFVAQGSSLFLVDQAEAQTVLVVVAEDETAMGLALERLAASDFSNCASHQALKVCSNDGSTAFGPDQSGEEGMDGAGSTLGKVFILSADAGEGVLTAAYDMESILTGAGYQVTVWSQYAQGLPNPNELAGYDAYVVDTGDYAWDTGLDEAVNLILDQSGSILVTGEQPFDVADHALLVDLEVKDDTHPLALGFKQGEVITLYDAAVPLPAVVLSDSGESSVVFQRGPGSEQAGSPVVVAVDDTDSRFVLAAFALYRLPEDSLSTLVLNMVSWLTYQS